MQNKGNNVISLNFGQKGNNERPSEPSLNDLIRFSLSPQMILQCVLPDCTSYSVHYSSQIDPDVYVYLEDELRTENLGNHVILVNTGWDEYHDEPVWHYGQILEIKISGVFMHAEFATAATCRYHRGLEDDMRKRAEKAFVMASALIGVPVRRELVVCAPPYLQ